MVRRKGRPRRSAEARKQGPDRKSLVKYVDESSSLPYSTGARVFEAGPLLTPRN